MARKKTLEQVRAEREKLEEKTKLEEQKLKILLAQEKDLERKARTHQLIVRGGMIEHYLDPKKTKKFTDDEIDEFFQMVIELPEVIEWLSKKVDKTDELPYS